MAYTGGTTVSAYGDGKDEFDASVRRGTRRYYLQRWQNLLKARQKDEMRWRAVQSLINGETGVYLDTEEEVGREHGQPTNTNPGNAEARLAARTLAAGLMSTITNPARRYLHFEPATENHDNIEEVKKWLDNAENRYYEVQSSTNWYERLQPLYLETGLYGQGALGGELHDENIVRYTSYSIGQFCMADNEYGETTTFFYRYHASVEQIVSRFVMALPTATAREEAFNALPDSIRRQWQGGHLEDRHEVVHGFFPNDDGEAAALRKESGIPPGKASVELNALPFKEVQFLAESGHGGDNDSLLDVSYHALLPVWVPRWNLLPNNVYATGPGWESLSDVMRLAELVEAEGEALEQLNSPAVQAPVGMRDQLHQVDLGPAAVNYVDSMNGKEGITPIFHYVPPLHHFEARISSLTDRIRVQFYNDLFDRISQMEKVSATAAQITITDRERVLQLAPIAERTTRDLLLPHAHWLLQAMVDSPNVDLEPPPEGVAGAPYRVRFSNIVSIAQKNEAARGAVNWLQVAMAAEGTSYSDMAGVVHPQRLGKVIAEAEDLPPETLRTESELQEWNEAKKQQEQLAQTLMQAQQAAQVSRDAGAGQKSAAEAGAAGPVPGAV